VHRSLLGAAIRNKGGKASERRKPIIISYKTQQGEQSLRKKWKYKGGWVLKKGELKGLNFNTEPRLRKGLPVGSSASKVITQLGGGLKKINRG